MTTWQDALAISLRAFAPVRLTEGFMLMRMLNTCSWRHIIEELDRAFNKQGADQVTRYLSGFPQPLTKKIDRKKLREKGGK